jgi:DNA replication protein DnaC
MERERAAALALIPPKFCNPRLETLVPRPDFHPEQAAKIAEMRAYPLASYLFCGANGVGKTHMAWALFAYAVNHGQRAVACKLDELLVEYRRFELARQDDPENTWRPRVLSEDLKQTGRRWTIFLDELEKSTPTEFAAKRLFALVDAAQEFGHQLVFTSNLTPEELQAVWSRVKVDGRYEDNRVWGNSIATRIAQSCTIIDLF